MGTITNQPGGRDLDYLSGAPQFGDIAYEYIPNLSYAPA